MKPWQNLASVWSEHVNNAWPEPPVHPGQVSSDGPVAGLLFSGNQQETVPTRLLLDKRLTPLDRNAWQVFKLLMGKDGFAVPRYEDLQPYLSTAPYGEKASRETVARVLTILRLTGWLSLVTRGRDATTGRIQGALYILHDEPISPAESLQIDAEYTEFAIRGTRHSSKAVRTIAVRVVAELRDDNGDIPTRLEVIEQRLRTGAAAATAAKNKAAHKAAHESELGNEPLVRIPAPRSSDSELGQKTLVRNDFNPSSESELGQISPSSDSELGRNPSKINSVRNPNSGHTYSTVQNKNSFNVLYSTVGTPHLRWPDALEFSPTEKAEALAALQALPDDLAQAVLNETAERFRSGRVRNVVSYLHGTIKRAHAGTFRLWAAAPTSSQASSSPPDVRHAPRPSNQNGLAEERTGTSGSADISKLARQCLDDMYNAVSQSAGGQRR